MPATGVVGRGVNPFAGYVDPLGQAHVTPERIDMGVDYSGTGDLAAIGSGVVTQVNPGGWGSFGNFMEYQITDNGPLKGQYVYYAEGVTPNVKVGDKITAGQSIARLIPGWHSGIEIGFGTGKPDEAYAAAHGGYQEGWVTEAGLEFSNLVKQLGGPPGVKDSSSVHGSGPLQAGGIDLTQIPVIGPVIGAAKTGIDVTEALANFVSNPIPALLTMAFVIIGVVMIYTGLGKMLGFQTPVRSTVKTAGKAAAAGKAVPE